MIRVLVVDDSPSVRELLVYILGSDPELEIIGCAADGDEAVQMTLDKNPDVITMDLHMPNVDGFEATRRIMETCPTPIVIVSGSESSTEMGASFRAISAGALVMVQRPYGPGSQAYHATSSALIRTVKSMAEVKVVRRWTKETLSAKPVPAGKADNGRKAVPKLVVMGASTGGPVVLRDILAELPASYPLPIVIVQHMSPGFVSGFADWLAASAKYPVSIAEQGASLAGGRAYLAPDGFHIGVTRALGIQLTRAAPEHGMCPSVAFLFRSVPAELCPGTAAVLLTGMGKDGATELRELKEKGAMTIVQDQATSAVYGMPGEAIRLDAARMILPPPEIGRALDAFGKNIASVKSLAGS